MVLYTRGFGCFVTSTTAPIATGWSDNCRVGIPPTERTRLFTAHCNFQVKPANLTSIREHRKYASVSGMCQRYGLLDVVTESLLDPVYGHEQRVAIRPVHLVGQTKRRKHDGRRGCAC